VGRHGCGCQYLPPWLIGWTSSVFTTLRGSSGPHHRSKQMHSNANHSCFGRDIRKDCVLVKVAESGINSFGRVAYAALRGEASLTTATVHTCIALFRTKVPISLI
jgi:hypothetical protein